MLYVRKQYEHLNEVSCLYPAERLQSLYDEAQDPDELDAIMYHLFQYDVAESFGYLNVANQIHNYFQGEGEEL
ncbi:hypothetical protein [Bacillus sp. OTU530]|uniref:hypothetical protein n=1 Tax=Bacillus sp. OTU530 TaxID=3043862 RepID=UPI00313DF198